MRASQEIRLDTRAGRVALLHWPVVRADARRVAPRVLCLHGWLDNAASFVPLAEQLQGLELYALDFPGHGHSDHRPPGARYAFTEYMFDVDAVLDALEWERPHLLGHSMGGGVACIYAAAAPERVDRIVVVDGLGPVSIDEVSTARQLRKSLEWLRRPRRPLRRFESVEDMTKARTDEGFLEISRDAAQLICERAARKVDEDDGGHYVWRTDPQLRWNTPVMLSEAQILNCLGQVESPVLSYHAQPWTIEHVRERMAKRQASLKHAAFRDVQGNHHFHMDEAARIAPEIEAFFLGEINID